MVLSLYDVLLSRYFHGEQRCIVIPQKEETHRCIKADVDKAKHMKQCQLLICLKVISIH